MIVSTAIAVLPVRAIADDQLALPLTDRDQRVDRADAGGIGCLTGLTLDDRRSDVFDRAETRRLDRALAVDRFAERIDDASEERLTDGDRRDAAERLTRSPSLISGVRTHDDDADVVLFEVEGTMPCMPFGNSTSSEARAASRP